MKKLIVLPVVIAFVILFNCINSFAAVGTYMKEYTPFLDPTASIRVSTSLSYYIQNGYQYAEKMGFKYEILTPGVTVTKFTIKLHRSGKYYIDGTGTAHISPQDYNDIPVNSSDFPYLVYDSEGYTNWNYAQDNKYFDVNGPSGTYIFAGFSITYTVNGVSKTYEDGRWHGVPFGL